MIDQKIVPSPSLQLAAAVESSLEPAASPPPPAAMSDEKGCQSDDPDHTVTVVHSEGGFVSADDEELRQRSTPPVAATADDDAAMAAASSEQARAAMVVEAEPTPPAKSTSKEAAADRSEVVVPAAAAASPALPLAAPAGPGLEIARVAALREELEGLAKMKELKARARAVGVTQDEIDEAEDENTLKNALKQALIALVLAKSLANTVPVASEMPAVVSALGSAASQDATNPADAKAHESSQDTRTASRPASAPPLGRTPSEQVAADHGCSTQDARRMIDQNIVVPAAQPTATTAAVSRAVTEEEGVRLALLEVRQSKARELCREYSYAKVTISLVESLLKEEEEVSEDAEMHQLIARTTTRPLVKSIVAELLAKVEAFCERCPPVVVLGATPRGPFASNVELESLVDTSAAVTVGEDRTNERIETCIKDLEVAVLKRHYRPLPCGESTPMDMLTEELCVNHQFNAEEQEFVKLPDMDCLRHMLRNMSLTMQAHDALNKTSGVRCSSDEVVAQFTTDCEQARQQVDCFLEEFPSHANTTSPWKRTLLFTACASTNLPAVECLLSKGAEPNVRNADAWR